MPIHRGKDQQGSYFEWGYSHGKKYYYTEGDPESAEMAKRLAQRQSAAAHAHGYKGK